MRLFEIATPKLYLFTDKEHDPGKEIHPPEDGVGPLGANIEGWLEQGRPEGRLPRSKSIFLWDRPWRRATFVYEVEPLGTIERGHTGWVWLLGERSGADQPLIDEWAASYWAGAECPTLNGAWEYRTDTVRVIGPSCR